VNRTEVAQLLTLASLIDSRIVSVETVAAWHDVIGDLEYDFAYDAMVRARRDAKVKYLEPRHIVENVFWVEMERSEDVSAARARGIVPQSWPLWMKLPPAAREQLAAARAAGINQERQRELDELQRDLADLPPEERAKFLPVLTGIDE